METIQLKIENLTGNELIIREGKALDQKAPEKIKICGDINSISGFLKKRDAGGGLQAVDANKALITVDKKNMKIELHLDPENFYGTEIIGSLELSDELKIFQINQVKTFTRDELVKLIKFNKLAFDNTEKHAEILKAYQSFTAQAATDLKQESDTRGNKANSFSKTVNSNIPTEFILNVPIFKGKESRTFRVEICLDVTDGGARFWFESTELHELIETRKEVLINEELKDFQNFVIINK